MPRTSLQEVLSVQDPLQTWNFDVVIPTIPGVSDARPISYKCIASQIPGSQVEQVALEAHGVKLHFAGRRQWTGTWTATFFETRDASTRDAMLKWLETARSWKNNSGNYKSVYSVTADVQLYDDLPQVIRTIRMFGLFPTNLEDVALDQTADIVKFNVTFSFDYTQDEESA
jgi:hypothetical protein